MMTDAHTATSPAISSAYVPEGDRVADAIGRYDHVTRLPNRVQILECLDHELHVDTSMGPKTLVLITLADAQHFNQILRALGHGFSEAFIRAGSERITQCMPAGTRLFNVSVLSFAFVVPPDALTPPGELAETVSRQFADPVSVQHIPIQTRVGIGMIDLTSDAGEPAEALRGALTAAQESRHANTAYAYYDHRTDAAHQRAFQILTDLPAALAASDQLHLRFQPRVDLTQDCCVSAEALLRWHHPEIGWISPGEFMPLAETTALISPLTRFVLEAAVRQLRAWRDAGRSIRVSVNVSPKNLAEPDFLTKLTGLLERHGVEPAALEVEFTEGAVSPDNATTVAHLRQLRELGVEVAIDDFGSGYSNMAYLSEIPADIVKIDKAFVLNLDTNPRDRFLTRTIADMAHGLGFHVVGEGVETASSYRFLADLGCREAQGFHLSKPLPPADLEGWLDG